MTVGSLIRFLPVHLDSVRRGMGSAPAQPAAKSCIELATETMTKKVACLQFLQMLSAGHVPKNDML